jgi:hypothetical protein
MGVGLGALGFCATTGCAGVAAGGGDSSFCFFDAFLPFGKGVALANLPFFANKGDGENTWTGLACSTRTNSF